MPTPTTPPVATFRDVTIIGKIVRVPIKPGDSISRNAIDSIEIDPSLTAEDLNHIIVRCADILRARAEQMQPHE